MNFFFCCDKAGREHAIITTSKARDLMVLAGMIKERNFFGKILLGIDKSFNHLLLKELRIKYNMLLLLETGRIILFGSYTPKGVFDCIIFLWKFN